MSKTVAKRGRGRPTSYRPEYAKLAFQFCLLGCTDKRLAELFEVAESNLNEWKKRYPDFQESIKRGREEADAKVGDSLYQRACGYSHKAVKIFADPKTGTEKIVPYTEHYPPDTVAAIFWLKNRHPDKWREKTEVAGTVTVTGLPEDVLERARKLALPAAPAK